MATDYFTATEFRRRQAHVFDLVKKGERVIIRRGRDEAYAITPIREERMKITPELQAEIDEAEAEYRNGETLHFETIEEMNAWLDSL